MGAGGFAADGMTAMEAKIPGLKPLGCWGWIAGLKPGASTGSGAGAPGARVVVAGVGTAGFSAALARRWANQLRSK